MSLTIPELDETVKQFFEARGEVVQALDFSSAFSESFADSCHSNNELRILLIKYLPNKTQQMSYGPYPF